LFARAGVAAGFSVAAGAHEGDAQGNEAVAEAGGFAGGKDKAGVGKHDAKGANELHEFAVAHVREWLKFACAGTKPGKRDGDLGFPADAQEVIGVSRDAERFESPIAEAVESANAETTKAGDVGTFGSFEMPIEIALRPGSVHVGINSTVVRFLIDDEAFRASFDDWTIFVGFHRADFEGDAGDFVVESADAIGHVVGRNKFGMFAGDEENVAEAVGEEFAGFFEDFIDGKSDSQNWVIPGEAAVFAIVDAFVGKIERRKKADDFAEALLGELLRVQREWRQKVGSSGRDKLSEIGQGRTRFAQAAADCCCVSAERLL
jgi:hypothetical protein